MAYVLHFFILRLRLRSTAEGRSFSRPNIRLRPEVKIVPTVQHCHRHLDNMLPIYSILSLPKQVSSLVPGFHNWYCFLIEQSNEQISQFVFLILYTVTEINTYVTSVTKWFVYKTLKYFQTMTVFRGATGVACAPKPDKTPIMAARRRRLLFFKIKVRPGSCRSYPIWRPWVIYLWNM